MSTYFTHGTCQDLRSQDVERVACDRLRERPFLPGSRVSCEYAAGTLLLRGRLSSYYHKQVAQEAVKGIEGVTDIVNEIEVLK
jgi:osmotically-inducible protein OsmY